MCLMCSCLKMLKNWLELYHKIGKEGYGCVFGRIFLFCISKAPNITGFTFEVTGLPYI